MKNKYAKFVKHFDKVSDRVIGGRFGNDVFLCDGFILLKLNVTEYEVSFRPEKPYYLELEDGEGFCHMKTDIGLPTKSEPFHAKELYDNAVKDAKAATFSQNVVRFKNSHIMTAFLGDDDVIGIQEQYYELFESITPMSGWVSKSAISPLYKKDVGLILPIRIDREVYADMKKMSDVFYVDDGHKKNVAVRLYKIKDIPEARQSDALDLVNIYAENMGVELDEKFRATEFCDDEGLLFDENGGMFIEYYE